MSQLEQVIPSFVQLGQIFSKIGKGEKTAETATIDELLPYVKAQNAWFTEANVRQSFAALSLMLNEQKLNEWLSAYPASKLPFSQKTVAIVMAGNIPMVGFHDLLCVLISGHKALLKLSKDDNLLLPAVLKLWMKIYPEGKDRVAFTDGVLKDFDAVIATGSTNTSRYFESYFSKYPHIIRKGRNSVAVLDGSESEEELTLLGKDIFDYFGMGCRNVTKLYLPADFDLNRFFQAIYGFADIVNHNKYANNYDYHKSLWLLNQDPILDNGFVLLKEDKKIASPIGALYYERYNDMNQVMQELAEKSEEIQCIVGKNQVPFGNSQCPMLHDYADGVDTMKFLQDL